MSLRQTGCFLNKKWAFFFSGRGSNLEAILNANYDKWEIPPFLVTDNPKARGIKVGQRFNLPTHILSAPINYDEISDILKKRNIQYIFLLGFLKIIPESFLKNWSGQIFNLHPSLLPKYPGLKSIERAYRDSAAIGVTIHRVIEGVDEGEILVQKVVLENSQYDHLSLEEVTSLVHSKEHQLVCDFITWGEQDFGSKI